MTSLSLPGYAGRNAAAMVAQAGDPKIDKPFTGLMAIAAAIAGKAQDWEIAWQKLEADPKNGSKLITSATAALNAAIEPYVDSVAELTGNSVSTIRQCFAPRGFGEVWFSNRGLSSPAEFLQNVARYRSFNPDYWAHQQRKEAKVRLLALVTASAPISVLVAAAEIREGRIPHLRFSDGDTSRSSDYSVSPLELELLENGILEPYDKAHSGRISSTKDFGFVLHLAGETGVAAKVLNFWPANRARNHIERMEVAPAPENPPAAGDGDVQPLPSKSQRARLKP